MSEPLATSFSPDYDEDKLPGGERHCDVGFSRRHVLRYFCDHCKCGRSSLSAIRRHVARCFNNPAAQACKTCAFFQEGEKPSVDGVYPGCPEVCGVGIDISGGIKVSCAEWEAVW